MDRADADWMRLLASIVLFLLGACVSTQAPSEVSAPYIETTISEIKKDPWAWHEKIVRITGTFNECISYTCQMCETEETFARLSEYYSRIDDPEFDFDILHKIGCFGVSFSGDDSNTDQEARFATAIIEGHYDAVCSGVQNPEWAKDPELEDTMIVCTDRGSELENAKIVKVLIRRPSTKGIITSYGPEPLAQVDEGRRKLINAAFSEFASTLEISDGKADFVFLFDATPETLEYFDVEAIGGACECISGNCAENDWPRREGDTWIETPLNPYKCWRAEKVDGEWGFLRD